MDGTVFGISSVVLPLGSTMRVR